MIIRNNKVLLGLRTGTRVYSGYWDLFGGSIENEEQVEDALLRELEEELGIIVKDSEFLAKVTDTHPITNQKYIHNIYLIKSWTGELKNKSQHEHAEIKWFDKNHVRNLKMVPWVKRLVLNVLTHRYKD